MTDGSDLDQRLRRDCRFELLRSGWPVQPHYRRCPWRCSPWSVLVAPLTPGYRLVLPHTDLVDVPPGCVSVVCSDTIHAYEVADPDRTRCGYLHLRYRLPGKQDLLGVLGLPPVIRGEVGRSLRHHMKRLHRLGSTPPSLPVSARLLSAGFALLGDLLDLPLTQRPLSVPLRSEVLLPALDYVRSHLDQPITVADLAAALGRSPAATHRLFRSLAEVTPMRFVWEQRLAMARDHLLEGDDPIAVIASACGFADPYHFSRAFKRRYGVAPQRFRAGYAAEL